MGRGTQASKASIERRVGVEREDHPGTCPDETGKSKKTGRRRTGPEPEPIVPLRLLQVVLEHFYPDFNERLDGIEDPRDPDRIAYTMRHLVWTGLPMLLCGMRSRLQLLGEGLRPGFHANLPG